MTNSRIHPLWGPFGGCEERFANSVLITNCISADLCNLMGIGPPLVSFSRLLRQFIPGLRFNASAVMNCLCQLGSTICPLCISSRTDSSCPLYVLYFFSPVVNCTMLLCLLMFSGFQAQFNNFITLITLDSASSLTLTGGLGEYHCLYRP